MPLTTQVRLLRVLETGEFIRVGSSKVQKTNVRVVAATNVNFAQAIADGRFREDLFYRLSQVPIHVPPLRERPGDIHMLFRKFTTDFCELYRMPPLRLTPDAVEIIEHYPWPGNIRQLKNTAEQISILETERSVDADTLLAYLPETPRSSVPVRATRSDEGMNEREILYKVLFDMRSELADLKRLVIGLAAKTHLTDEDEALVERLVRSDNTAAEPAPARLALPEARPAPYALEPEDDAETEEVLSLQDSERDLIRKALEKHRNRRKNAAQELGISERTLYRKIKEYGLK